MLDDNQSESLASVLKLRGCMRIRVTDRKNLATERGKANVAAAVLGRCAYSSYRYPYLYVRLGEYLPATDSTAGESGPTHAHMIESERA